MILIKRICTWFSNQISLHSYYSIRCVFFSSSFFFFIHLFCAALVCLCAFTINSFAFGERTSMQWTNKNTVPNVSIWDISWWWWWWWCSQKRECKCAKKQHESFIINIHRSISPTNTFATYGFFLSINDFQSFFFCFVSSTWIQSIDQKYNGKNTFWTIQSLIF